MADEKITIGELGAYTNNSMNKEGLKKLVDKVNNGGSSGDAYTKAETDALLATKQGTLTAGTNVEISEQNVISATDTKYTAGTNVAISDQNVISATDTVYTAGTGITISDDNVISTTGGSVSSWTERTPNKDWSDLFEVTNTTTITAKKDIYLYYDSTPYNINLFIPKGFSTTYGQINLFNFVDVIVNTQKIRTGYCVIMYNQISSSSAYFNVTSNEDVISYDNGNIVITRSTTYPSILKSAIKIYTRD